MDAALLDLKPISALPPHLLNEDLRVQKGRSPLRTSVGAKEREKLTASILSSSGRNPAIDLDTLYEPKVNGYDVSYSRRQEQYLGNPPGPPGPPGLDMAARDPRDGPTERTMSYPNRPASPYTLNPPIDFDGLSWPSELGLDRLPRATTEAFTNRSWDKGAPRSHPGASSRTPKKAQRGHRNHFGMPW
jgi:GTP cyclohydrolase IA